MYRILWMWKIENEILINSLNENELIFKRFFFLNINELVLIMPSMNMSRGIRQLLSLSIFRNKSVNRDFL